MQPRFSGDAMYTCFFIGCVTFLKKYTCRNITSLLMKSFKLPVCRCVSPGALGNLILLQLKYTKAIAVSSH